MQFLFIRHGQSENNLLWEETGTNKGRSEDPELTEKGLLQATLLADFIVRKDKERQRFPNNEITRDQFQFTHLYTSLMVRSVKTAYTLSDALGIPLHAWPEIHECGGIYMENDGTKKQVGLPGKTRSYFAQHYQNLNLPEIVTDEGWYNRQYESELERPQRARQVLETLLQRHGNTEDRVAIVSHGGFYMELIRVLFNVPTDQSWFLMNNTGISRFDFEGESRIVLVYHNRTDHLDQSLIT
ncbi:MAG: histidine phosphatase family protein [Anaerolineaceae bacterium]|nr:histidine phosphatase family protein [Anaerolineaceae bacterium]